MKPEAPYLPPRLESVYGDATVDILPDGHRRDPEALKKSLRDATFFQATPSSWRLLLEAGWKGNPRLRGVCGGEAWDASLAIRLRPLLGQLWNMFGPTEATVWCSGWSVPHAPRKVVLGPAFPSAEMWVVDSSLQLAPVGVAGELCISGPQLADGYHGRAALTAERFIPNPFGPPGDRAYRTGDRVRWNEDGTQDFLGRLDFQVKLRGYRIELGEIEAAIEAWEGVDRAVVVLRDARLCAYVLARGELDVAALTRSISEILPSYMVPASFTSLDAFPVNSSGKLDRRRLPEPALARAEYEPPLGDLETAMAELWRELLGVPTVGRDDDFFALGGDSLLATRLVALVRRALDRELPLRAVFATPRLRGMVGALVMGNQVPPLVPVARTGRLPASYGQERLWVLYHLDPTSSAYHLPALVQVAGLIDEDALERALKRLVERHEALRTRLFEDAEGLWQVVEPIPSFRLGRERLPPDAALAHARARVIDLPFDFEAGHVMRAACYTTAPDRSLLAFCMHHIASDGVSMRVLVRELGLLYAAEVGGAAASLPPLTVQYVDYAVWQRAWMEGEGELDRQLAYWTEQLRGVEPLALASEGAREALPSDGAVIVPVALTAAMSGRVLAFAHDLNTTPYVVWLALFGALLGRLGGQRDITVGSPVANRRDPQLEHIIGFFANTIVQRIDLSGRPNLEELVSRVHEVALRTQEHQDAPFEKVVEACHVPRDMSRAPLFQASLTYTRASDEEILTFGDVGLAGVAVPIPAKFDLALDVSEGGGETKGVLKGRASLFRREPLERMAALFARLCQQALVDPRLPLDLVDWADPDSKAAVEAFSEVEPRPPSRSNLLERLEAVVAAHPTSDAVRWAGGAWTHAELWEHAGRLASNLRRAGVGADDRVMVLTERNQERIAALVGVLRAGAGYVAADDAVPPMRLLQMAEVSGAVAVICDEASRGRAEPLHLKTFAAMGGDGSSELESFSLHPSSLAYISFTSGSTGTPKGVAVSHANVLNLVDGPSFADLRGCVFLHLTVPDFDPATLEIFGALCNGGTVAVASHGALDPERLDREVVAMGVDTCVLTTGLFHVVATERPHFLSRFRTVVVGGDVMQPNKVLAALDALPPGGRLINAYGPTENTVITANRIVVAEDAAQGRVPIGLPAPGTRAYVLDAQLAPCVVGVIGELWAAGLGVSRGYHGRPGMTADRFLPDPFGDAGARMYRTGDLARWNADGTLDFLGRADQQIKLRGFRIELGEVEAVLESFEGVAQAAVVAISERLCAYLVPAVPNLDTAQLHQRAKECLPQYMLPAAYTVMDALPLTAAGKLDRRALPRPLLDQAEFEPPRGEAETALAAIWVELLGVDRVGRADDFFALGGHSLLATRLVARVASELDRELPLRAVFTSTRLRAMAEALGGGTRVPRLERISREERLPASYAQERMWVLHQLDPNSSAYHMPALLEVSGALEVDALERALCGLVERHEVLRTWLLEDAVGLAQEVRRDAPLKLERYALEGEEAYAHARAWVREPFALDAGELLRAAVYSTQTGTSLLAFCMHHIASDGVSMEVLVQEIGALYAAEVAGRDAELAPLPVQYADYAVWQREWMEGQGELERQLAFWREQLRGVEPLALPTDYARPAMASGDAGTVRMEIPWEVSASVETLAREEGTTPYVVWLSLFGELLGRESRQTDLTIGSPIANRRDPQLEGLIGFFVNTVVQRIDRGGRPTFRELVRRTHETALRTQEHQDAPFEKIVEASGAPRDLSSSPLFQAMLAFQSRTDASLEAAGLTMRALQAETAAKFDLNLSMTQGERETVARLTYRRSIFSAQTAAGWARRLLALAAAVLKEPDALLESVWSITRAEAHQVVEEFQPALPEDAPDIVTAFERRTRERPEAPALRFGEHTLSYAELNDRANSVASALERMGVVKGGLVALRMERGIPLMEAVLGVWKAGAAYLPIEPTLPVERREFMRSDANAAVELSAADVEAMCDSPARGWRSVECASGVPAYLLYTSGTTGRPKGVWVSRGGLARYAANARDRFPMGGESLLHGTLSFDATVASFLPVWLEGGCVTLAAPGQGLEPLQRALEAGEFDLVKGTPTHLAALDPALRRRGRAWLVGGEPLPEELTEGLHVFNQYGPTECTVGCTSWDSASATRLSLGRPFPGTRAYVLDDALQPCPIHVRGELYLAGEQLAHGYHRRAALTSEKFVPDPFGGVGARMYRTGDLVRWNEDGTLDYLGRIDTQIKLRGYRIELGEIEATLEAQPSVQHAGVAVRGERVCAYLVPTDATMDVARVREALGRVLPDYMVPVAYTVLEALPQTSSGKLDRKALPEPDLAQAEYEEPRGELEETLAALWQSLLGAERVGREDDFFALGGHSLLATRLVARVSAELGRDLPLRAVFMSPTLRAMALSLGGEARMPALLPVSRAEALPASYAQQRLWVLHRLDPSSSAYHMPVLLEVAGSLDDEALERALQALVLRHEVLRTRLFEDGSGLWQEVGEGRPVLERYALDGEEALSHAGRWVKAPFAIETGEVLRAALYRTDEDQCLLAFCMHHIASDGVSMEVLVREISALYAAEVAGGKAVLSPLSVQYADYAVWQRKWMESEGELERQLAFWTEQLRGVEPLALPTDHPRPVAVSGDAAQVSVPLTGDVLARLAAFAREEGTTPYVVWLALLGELLGRTGRQTDLTIGSPIANRRDPRLEGLIGFFANTVVQRIDRSGRPSFREAVARTHEVALRTQEHQDAPFEKVVDACEVARDTSSTPLFQAMLSYRGPRGAVATLGDVALQSARVDPTAQFDLSLVVGDAGPGSLIYRTTLYERETMERLARRLVRLIEGALEAPERPLTEVSWLDPEEREQLLHTFNATDIEVSLGPLVERFRRVAAVAPEAEAVRFRGEAWSYRQLDVWTDALATRIGRGASESRVGVLLERGLSLVGAVWGIWKASAVYMPIDPTLPFERLAFMIEDAAPDLIVTTAALASRVPTGVPVLLVEDVDESEVDAPPLRTRDESSAYLIYTSGSTGRPKGVLSHHAGLINRLAWMQTAYPLEPNTRVGHKTSIGFDVSVWELSWPLLFGATVCLLEPGEQADSEALQRWLHDESVEVIHFVPSMLQTWLETTAEPNGFLRRVICSGEALTDGMAASFARALPGVALENLYGPTEAAIDVTRASDCAGAHITLGAPVANTRAYVLEVNGEPAPLGVSGELILAGVQLAHGYQGRSALTAERFIPDPFGPPGSRMYRTGDLARWNEDGTLDYLGRIDTQVKLRGYRIELGEIEAALESCEDIQQAAVAIRSERLCAYLVALGDLDVEAVRASLARRLPEYMVPASFTQLEALPLTSSGKLDRRALPEPGLVQAEYEEPRGEFEKTLAALWKQLLDVERVGREDDFFALGGHSLLATRLVARVASELERELPLRAVFTNSTLTDMARCLAAAPRVSPASSLKGEVVGDDLRELLLDAGMSESDIDSLAPEDLARLLEELG